jgi:hypothetical protein
MYFGCGNDKVEKNKNETTRWLNEAFIPQKFSKELAVIN